MDETDHSGRIVVRPAQADEADALTDISMRSKAHWGYDDAFMAQCVESLRVDIPEIEAGRVIVAEGPEGLLGVMGWAPLEAGRPDEPDWEISHLFVDPSAMGRGVGRLLFEEGIVRIRTLGCNVLEILSDPEAKAFYERMGATPVGDAPSDAIPGRRLPLLQYTL